VGWLAVAGASCAVGVCFSGTPAAAVSASAARAVGADALARSVQWQAYAVGRRERSLQLVEFHGVCGPIHATVRETHRSVVIEIQEEPRGGVCITLGVADRREVPLAQPLAGRVIRGGTRGTGSGGGFAPGVLPSGVVPRLIGFAPQDARFALGLASLRIHTRSLHRTVGLGRVVAQEPAPGRKAPRNRTIRVAVAGG
jgi:hypothetical protein